MKKGVVRKVMFLVFVASLLTILLIGCAEESTAPEEESPTLEEFPTKTITLIVPWGVGGSTDMAGRALASISANELGVGMVVVNKPGGLMVIGAKEVANAEADGYTVGFLSHQLVVSQYTSVEPPSLDDYEYVVGVSSAPFVIVVHGDSPWNDFAEFVEYAKQNPGAIKNGVSGIGSSAHIAMAGVEAATGIVVTHVPYEGGYGGTVAGFITREVQSLAIPPGNIEQLLADGTVRILAIASNERLEKFPDVPTLAELGYDFEYSQWDGLMVPKGTPRDVVEKLANALDKVMNSEEFISYLNKAGFDRFDLKLDEFEAFVRADDIVNRDIISTLALDLQ